MTMNSTLERFELLTEQAEGRKPMTNPPSNNPQLLPGPGGGRAPMSDPSGGPQMLPGSSSGGRGAMADPAGSAMATPEGKGAGRTPMQPPSENAPELPPEAPVSGKTSTPFDGINYTKPDAIAKIKGILKKSGGNIDDLESKVRFFIRFWMDPAEEFTDSNIAKTLEGMPLADLQVLLYRISGLANWDLIKGGGGQARDDNAIAAGDGGSPRPPEGRPPVKIGDGPPPTPESRKMARGFKHPNLGERQALAEEMTLDKAKSSFKTWAKSEEVTLKYPSAEPRELARMFLDKAVETYGDDYMPQDATPEELAKELEGSGEGAPVS